MSCLMLDEFVVWVWFLIASLHGGWVLVCGFGF